MSDRLFGLIVLIGSVAYFMAAASIPTGFLVDPVGPKLFPRLVSGLAALCALLILIRPDAEPDWPGTGTWLRLLLALAVLVAYAYTLKPLGFLIPTAVASGVLSFQIRSRLLPAVLTGLGLSVGLFILFRFVLGLSLFAIPRTWMS
ncbi:MAG: tripartite tricarboxylate transporter TctB family protein [Granulosicoccus sp.]|nr:tripartite tricarboxylate transporter TctB family protein [Granulosicoccus sp.]